MITKTESAALRGFAILGIILHNYTHWLATIVKENEFTFSEHNVRRLMMELSHPSWELIAHLLSFFGHYGVPVFLFLSGYGLVRKYEDPPRTSTDPPRPSTAPPQPSPKWGGGDSALTFIGGHYKKLFVMMIMGYGAFLLVDHIMPPAHHYSLWNIVGEVGMFSNFYAIPDKAIWPGPYWYFGLMVQVYIVYRLIIYRGTGSLSGRLSERGSVAVAVTLAVGCIAIQMLLEPESDAMNWYRYNVFGALPEFVLGVLVARYYKGVEYQRSTLVVFSLLMLVLIVGGSLTFATWNLVPLAVCAFNVSLIKVIPKHTLSLLAWVGGISSALFVTQAIARKIIIPVSRHGELFEGILLYLICALVLGVIWKKCILKTS